MTTKNTVKQHFQRTDTPDTTTQDMSWDEVDNPTELEPPEGEKDGTDNDGGKPKQDKECPQGIRSVSLLCNNNGGKGVVEGNVLNHLEGDPV